MISRRYSFIIAAALVLISFTVAVNSAISIRVETEKAVFATDEKFLSASSFVISVYQNPFP